MGSSCCSFPPWRHLLTQSVSPKEAPWLMCVHKSKSFSPHEPADKRVPFQSSINIHFRPKALTVKLHRPSHSVIYIFNSPAVFLIIIITARTNSTWLLTSIHFHVPWEWISTSWLRVYPMDECQKHPGVRNVRLTHSLATAWVLGCSQPS